MVISATGGRNISFEWMTRVFFKNVLAYIIWHTYNIYFQLLCLRGRYTRDILPVCSGSPALSILYSFLPVSILSILSVPHLFQSSSALFSPNKSNTVLSVLICCSTLRLWRGTLFSVSLLPVWNSFIYILVWRRGLCIVLSKVVDRVHYKHRCQYSATGENELKSPCVEKEGEMEGGIHCVTL